jgi:hypothetical protein
LRQTNLILKYQCCGNSSPSEASALAPASFLGSRILDTRRKRRSIDVQHCEIVGYACPYRGYGNGRTCCIPTKGSAATRIQRLRVCKCLQRLSQSLQRLSQSSRTRGWMGLRPPGVLVGSVFAGLQPLSLSWPLKKGNVGYASDRQHAGRFAYPCRLARLQIRSSKFF